MGPEHLLCLLLAALVVSGLRSEDDENEVYMWPRQSLPLVLDRHTELLNTPMFRGQEEDEEGGGTERRVCGIECQSALSPVDQTEQEWILGYETMYDNGTRTQTEITLQGFNKTSPRTPARTSTRIRSKRQVYGADGRFVISDSQFTTNYPFSTAVRLSTGCSGVLVSARHVLTAAHCIHDGRDYLGGVRRLRVGVLQLKTKRGRGGRRRGGRRRGGGRRGEGETGEEKREGGIVEEGEEQNGIDGEMMRRTKGRKERRQRGKKGGEEGAADRGNIDKESRGGSQTRPRLNRIRRSTEVKKQPVFRWTRVKQTRIPKGWIHTESSTNSLAPDYDYALLELKRPVRQKHMELGVAPSNKPLARIHFSGYDADKGLLDGHGDEKVVYRFCPVTKESDELMYQRCDAQQGATGAGVYIRLRQEADDGAGRKGMWQRRVIGVFSGHRWVEEEEGEQRDFNVAVRITPPKYAQICHWIHGDPGLCKEV